MVEQHSDPPKRVVKKVVKRTVVRETPSPPERTARTARLSTRTRLEPPRRPSPPVAAPRKPAARKAAPRTATPRTAKQPRLSMPSIKRPSINRPSSAPDIRGRVGDFFIGIWHFVIDTIADSWHWLAGVRLPILSPLRASVITGLLVGCLAVGLGWGFYQVFRATLGTSAGGRWGFLALVFVGFLVFITGELLLAGFGVAHARAISILAVLMVFVLIMLLFIDLASGIWAIALVPALCVAAYSAACTAMVLAGAEPNAQRIPWEPTDDSTVT
jgi:hypothetical protein